MTDTTQRREVARSPLPNDGVAVTYQDPMTLSVFSDGVARMSIAPQVTRIQFFSVIDTQTEGAKIDQERLVNLELIIPTGSLFEWVGNLKQQIPQFMGILEAGNIAGINSIKEIFKD